MSLTKITGIVIVLFLAAGSVKAQDHLPFTPESEDGVVVRDPWLAPSAGYVPSNNALRLSVVTGNLLLNRAGGYVTLEKGLDSGYFSNIYGLTFTATRYIYLWGGFDLFTNRGIFHSLKGSRKEIGVGVMPWKDLTIGTGWSKSVGFTFSLGWKLPLVKHTGK